MDTLGRLRSVKIKLEIDEKVVILHLLEVEKTQVLFLLLVYLHVTVVPHNPLEQSTGCQSI